MGPVRIHIEFSGAVPTAAQLIAEALRIGGLALVAEENAECNHTVVHFAAFPEGRVTIKVRPTDLWITDYSMQAEVLYWLLWQASVGLGGKKECLYPVPLPVSEAYVRSERKSIDRFVPVFLGFLALMYCAAIAAVVAIVWWLVS